MTKASDQRPQPRPVAAQPALVLAIVGPALLDELPEATRVVHHVEVRDLVLDDVREDRLGSQQQPPAEAHGARGRATGPAARRVADLQLRVGAGGPERRPVQAPLELEARVPRSVARSRRSEISRRACRLYQRVSASRTASSPGPITPTWSLPPRRLTPGRVRHGSTFTRIGSVCPR